MAYDARIILAGQQPDIVNVLARSTAAAGAANQQRQQNALNQLYQTQGANILAGDQGALNALAGINPMAALDVQNTRQTMDIRNRQEARLSAADKRAQQVADAERQLKQFGMSTLNAPSPEEYDRLMAENGYPQFVGTYDNRQSVIAGIVDGPLAQIAEWNKQQAGKKRETADDVNGVRRYVDTGEPVFPGVEKAPKERETAQDVNGVLRYKDTGEPVFPGVSKPPEPSPIAALEARARAANLTPGTPEYQQFMLNNGGQQKGMRIVSDGKGGITIEQDGGITDKTDVTKPSSPAAMIATIDGLLNDEAFDKSTGMMAYFQAVPNTPQHRVGQRFKQLEGQAFLQAFESLKGGGQITEIEGAKATQAIGRLASTQAPEDIRQALTELRDLLQTAMGRPPGWAEQQSAQPKAPATITSDADYEALPSGTVFIAPDGTQRRKP